jgi:tripartite-type tricarboxylate transporter receptor subunit TctC
MHTRLSLALLLGLSAAIGPAAAQSYPVKSIRFVVPFAPGGGTDFVSRLIAVRLTETLGQPVLVDNRPGAGGAIGAELVAKSPADGYTIMLASPGSLSINPHMSKTNYDPLRDFAPIALATISPFAMSATLALPANSVKELIALAKAKPGALTYGSSGNGSTGHIAGEQLKILSKINILHVPFKGSAGVSSALLSGEIQLGFENLPVVLSLSKAGKLKLLGVASAQRSPLAPEVPTISEGGVPGFETITAFGVVAPAKTPAYVIEILNREIVKLLRQNETRDMLAARGMQAIGDTPQDYARFLRREYEKYGDIIKKAGIRLEGP